MKTPRTPSIHTAAFALAAALSLAALSTAQAQLIAYDGFDYSAATVVGDNGGTGWIPPNNVAGNNGSTWTDASWQNPTVVPWINNPGQTMFNNRPDAMVVTTPALTYANNGYSLTTSGNTLDIGKKSAMRAWNVPTSFSTTPGSALWASFLVDITYVGASGQKYFFEPFGNGGSTVGGTNYQFGAGALFNYTTQWTLGAQIRTSGVNGYAAPANLLTVNANQTCLVTMEFIYNGGGGLDSEQLWLNPTLGGSAPLGSDLTTGAVLGTLDLSGYWFVRCSTSTTGFGDEFRIGDTYGDVTPATLVPEPSTCALLLIGGALACGAARRRGSLSIRR